MTWAVSPLTREEVPEAVAVLLSGSLAPADERPEEPERYWAATLATRARGGEVLVARDASGVIGVVELMILPHFQHAGGWCAELESFFVRPDRRSKGVGAALLAAAEERAVRAGCYRIQLTSRNVRTDAHRFYRRHGFDQGSQGFKKPLAGGSGDGGGYADLGGGDEQQR
ncbi:MAG: GNAT family N-acetyltransferase [Acidimicrobiales bacterium]